MTPSSKGSVEKNSSGADRLIPTPSDPQSRFSELDDTHYTETDNLGNPKNWAYYKLNP